MAGEVKVIIVGDAKKLKGALSDAGGALSGFEAKAAKHGSGIGSAMSGMAGKVVAAFAAFQVISKATDYLGDALKAAAEDAGEQVKLAKVLENTTGATEAQSDALEDWISKTQLATGVIDSDLRSGLTKLLPVTKNVTRAEQILGVAMDTAAARGDDLDSVVTALAKAALGNTASLQKMGIETKNAAGEAKTFDDLLQDLAATYGGTVAAAADTAEGKMARLAIAFGEVKETVGMALLPTMEKLADWTIQNMPQIESTVATVAGGIADAFGWVSDDAIPAVIGAFESLKRDAQDPLSTVGRLVEGVRQALDDLGIKSGEMWPSFVSELQEMADTAGAILGALEGAIAAVRREYERMTNAPGKMTLGGGGGGWSAGGGDGGSTAQPVYARAIPMAAGGIVHNPTLAVVGEAGPEAVVPLSRGFVGGGITVQVNVAGSVISERDLDRAIVNSIRRVRLTSGAVV